MKRIVSLLLVLVLVVAMSVPVMALSTTTKSVSRNGTHGQFGYTTTTSASVRNAKAELTYGKNANLYASITAQVSYPAVGSESTSISDSDFASDLSVSTSVSVAAGLITEATGRYMINSNSLTPVTVK